MLAYWLELLLQYYYYLILSNADAPSGANLPAKALKGLVQYLHGGLFNKMKNNNFMKTFQFYIAFAFFTHSLFGQQTSETFTN